MAHQKARNAASISSPSHIAHTAGAKRSTHPARLATQLNSYSGRWPTHDACHACRCSEAHSAARSL
eukprot:304643-Prymnesium_polylepis.4